MTRTSKTLPPAVSPLTIPRPALEERLDEALAHRLTTLVAGAGFGKSTLLARWGARVGCAWYTIDRRDMTLATLAYGLAVALKRRVRRLPPYLSEVPSRPGTDSPARAAALAAHLSEALQELLEHDLVLVLDDVQDIDPGSPSARLLEGLCRHAPDRLHILLSSRSEPPFPIERLRGRGQVLDVDPATLAFSDAETRAFFAAVLGDEGVGLAKMIREMTGGWPAAVRLALEALRTVEEDRRTEVLGRLRRPEGPIFGYLAGEVFSREPDVVRDLLRRAAPFDRFTAELCEDLGALDASGTLASLVKRGLFVQPQGGGEGWFVLHALVREFVLRSWPLEEREHEALHRRAAEWFEKRGYLVEALHSMAAVSDPAEVARLIAERGPEILARGAVDSVLELSESVPAELRSERLEEILGEAHTVRGEPSRAEECFRRAAKGSAELPPGLAWRIGLMHHERGEHQGALEVYGRGRIDGSRPADEAMLLAAIGTTHLLIGDVATAKTFTARALPVAERSGDGRALAAVHAALMMEASRRHPRAADRHYRLALEAAENAGDVLLAIRLRTNRASHLDDKGRYREALGELEIAIRQAELSGYTERLALALNNRGWTRFHLGRLEEAIGDTQRAKALYESAGSIRVAWPLMNLGAVYRERGDLALARAVLDEALALAERMGDVQGLIGARANLARILAHDDPEEANRLAEEAVQVGRSWSGLVDALIAAGWVALATGGRERAAGFVEEAVGEARSQRNRAGLAEALELAAMSSPLPAEATELLEEATSIWGDIENPLGLARCELALARLSSGPASHGRVERAERGLRLLGVRPHAAAGAAGLFAALPRGEQPPVAIRTLGGFRVLREGVPAAASEWQSKKARDLVKILVSRRGRPVPREALMEALWPEEDPGPLARRLAVALATARGVFDPLRRVPSDHFIGAEDSALWVDLDHLSVDVVEFLADAASGMSRLRTGQSDEARDVLEAAEARYTGDYLEEDLYEDWAAPLREEALSTYITVVRALAGLACDAGDPQASVDYRLRILERDPYDEEAHLGLVATLSGIGRHGEARRFYRQYVARMEELGVEPVPMPVAAQFPANPERHHSTEPTTLAPSGG
ncbi:MAG: tetratricopeptide repeat protein [Gemmatimonadota bacterium]